MPTKSKSRTITDKPIGLVERRMPASRPPTHPGEMLRSEFLDPAGITQTAFATRLGVSFPRLNEIIKGRRPPSIPISTFYELDRIVDAVARHRPAQVALQASLM